MEGHLKTTKYGKRLTGRRLPLGPPPGKRLLTAGKAQKITLNKSGHTWRELINGTKLVVDRRKKEK